MNRTDFHGMNQVAACDGLQVNTCIIMRGTLALTALFLLTGTLYAQQTIPWDVDNQPYKQQTSFLSPQRYKALLDYRLPDWGYTSLFFSASPNGDFDRQQDENSQLTISSRAANLAVGFYPNYRLYKESETRILNVRIQASTGITNQVSSSDIGSTDLSNTSYRKDRNTSRLLYPQVDVNYFRYRNAESDAFLLSTAKIGSENRTSIEYYRYNEVQNQIPTSTGYRSERYKRQSDASFALGFGRGRLRDVTPVLYAIRFRDRLQTLGIDAPEDDNSLQNMARQFARYSGYARTGFRNDKFFWRDVFASAGIATPLTPYQFNYLTETNAELVGGRLEGKRWYVLPSIRMHSQHTTYTHITPANNFGLEFRYVYGGIVFRHEQYQNKSLEKQVRTTFNIEYFNGWNEHVNRNTTLQIHDRIRQFSASFNKGLLLQAADRFIINTSAGLEVNSYKYFFAEEAKPLEGALRIGNRFDYFVERGTSLSLEVNLAGILETNRDARYFDRNLRGNFMVSISHFFQSSLW